MADGGTVHFKGLGQWHSQAKAANYAGTAFQQLHEYVRLLGDKGETDAVQHVREAYQLLQAGLPGQASEELREAARLLDPANAAHAAGLTEIACRLRSGEVPGLTDPEAEGSALRPDRVKVAPRTVDELAADKIEDVELADWTSGWLAASWAGEPVPGYARLSEGPLGEVIASFTLMVPEGFGSSNYSPATISFLRYDPARNSVDYIVHIEEFPPGWSLEGATEVGDDFAEKVTDTWPAVIFQQLIDVYPALDVRPLGLEQAQEMGWQPDAEDLSSERLWRPIDLSTD